MKPTSPAHEHHHHEQRPVPRQESSSAGAKGNAAADSTPAHTGHAAHDRHAGHSVEMFRDRFWITLLLTIPTLVWSGMIQQWFGFSAPTFAGSAYVPAIFGAGVYA